MKIAVLGAGAVGSLFGGWLSRAGQVWLIVRNRQFARAVANEGLTVAFPGGEERFFLRTALDPAEVGPVDLILVAVKSYDTLEAARGAWPLIAEGTTVLSIQNGIGNLEILQKIFGPERVLAGSTGHGARMIGPGKVFHSGSGETLIAEPAAARGRAAGVARVFESSGIKACVSNLVETVLWGKLIINCAVNPVTALLGLANGQILESLPAWELASEAVIEAAKVVRARGVALPYPEPIERLREVCAATALNRSSMLVDLETRGKTEIDFINGALVEEADRLGVEVPVNRCLWRLVKAREAV